MTIKFKSIAILGYPRDLNLFLNHKILYDWLIKKGYNVVIEKSISKFLNLKNPNIATLIQIGEKCELGIVIGGDGNMLCVLKKLFSYPIKIIGINCGNLGFLADLNPDDMIVKLSEILSGFYYIEKRFLLEVNIFDKKIKKKSFAINEIVLHPEKISKMIEFEVYISKKFAFYQRSDGIIISTPTGSTGYALSAGGPILSLSSKSIVIVPMLPHTLSARPIVISNNDIIKLKLFNLENKLKISCDGQVKLSIFNEKKIYIYKSKYFVNFIHPNNYHYLNVLRKKLNWSKNFF
ncbi:NAD(+) kinase [Buchnera aphidicola]|uniref:NAD kinase n=1 Tax=Buchnera aphidicola (Therioaphis trifolii) TaxID=1241884 RepID=A0A4D6YB39_9GAMM|nr:NAD(+) kinase [Buchnera aphidicola]QCI27137.1 NAD(+) kinase [Buchnera aphidicola (Therioaphis trifolii)]